MLKWAIKTSPPSALNDLILLYFVQIKESLAVHKNTTTLAQIGSLINNSRRERETNRETHNDDKFILRDRKASIKLDH
jgi:hypothetical protein